MSCSFERLQVLETERCKWKEERRILLEKHEKVRVRLNSMLLEILSNESIANLRKCMCHNSRLSGPIWRPM